MLPQIYLSFPTSAIDENLTKLLRFYDLDYKILESDDNIPSESCLFFNCGILNNEIPEHSFKDSFYSRFSKLFLYNLFPSCSTILEWVTESKVSVSSINDDALIYKISDNNPEICKQLSGFAFHSRETNKEFCFKATGHSIRSLIDINSKPYFISFANNSCEIFAVANMKIIDLDLKVTSEDFKISNLFSEFVPILMFLKYMFKDKYWHPPNDYACFIIDDPLLKRKYGFLDFKELLSLMDEYNFCSNIAFIPYNYDRSENEVVRMFNERDDRFSISVHGCDHCEAEFGITDEKELNRRVKLTLSRMDKHKDITKVEYNKVMVFPQGSFSSNSLKLLKANNYLGAINSKVLADDFPYIDIAAFFTPANMNYFNFPLFLRRYPEDLSDFALDLFMGKPLFFVEHHGFFKDGYKKLCDFVTYINNNFRYIKWKSPQYILNNFYLERKEDDSRFIKIFTNDTIIKNDSNKEVKCNIVKREDGVIPIEEVLINGRKSNYTFENNAIKVEIKLKAKEQIEIRFFYRNLFGTSKKPGLIASYKVFMRRRLT